MTPLDLMEALHDVPEDLLDFPLDTATESRSDIQTDESEKVQANQPIVANQTAVKTSEPHDTVNSPRQKYGSAFLSYLLTAGCTAACIAGFAMLIHFTGAQDDFSYRSGSHEIAVTEIEPAATALTTETTTVTTTATASPEETETMPAVQTETETVTAAETALPADTVPVPQTTVIPGTTTHTAAAETVTQKTTLAKTTVTTIHTTTQATTTTAASPAPVYEMGDVDMDGKITFADALLVEIDYQLAERGMSAQSFLNDEQRALGNMNGKDDGRYWDGISYAPEWNGSLNEWGQQIKYEPYPLSGSDSQIIEKIVFWRNWMTEPVTAEDFQDDNRVVTYYNPQERRRLADMQENEPETYQEYDAYWQVYAKWSDVFYFENKLTAFLSDADSLTEFWADMEYLRGIYDREVTAK